MLQFKCDFCCVQKSLFVLPCLHTSCKACLNSLVDCSTTSATIIGVAPCLKCGTQIPVSKDGIPKKLKTLSVNDLTNIHTNGARVCSHLSLILSHSNPEASLPLDTDADVTDINIDLNSVNKSDLSGCNFAHSFSGVISHNYCCECDMILCKKCTATATGSEHVEHNVVECDSFVKHKKEYLNELLNILKNKLTWQDAEIQHVNCLSNHLSDTFDTLKAEIQQRADDLCEVIIKKKESMIRHLYQIITKEGEYYKKKLLALKASMEFSKNAFHFANFVIKESTDLELINLHNDISSKLSDLVHETEETLQLCSVKVDVPDKGKEEVYLDRLFGQIMQGEVVCGNAELVSTFQCDLNWPTAMDVTSSYEYLVTGKYGAFEQEGQVLSCDRKGNICMRSSIPNKQLPCDILYTKSNKILLTASEGMVYTLAKSGTVTDVWNNAFSGGGKIAEGNGNIYITSTKEGTVNAFSTTGRLLSKIEIIDDVQLKPHLICVDGNRMVITSEGSEKIYFSDLNGNVTCIYDCAREKVKPIICASALCFDPLGNLLISDFSADSVHIVSRQGHALGHLLTKRNGISCPNSMMFDRDGHLLIGQYGGDVKVFRYLSCEKYT